MITPDRRRFCAWGGAVLLFVFGAIYIIRALSGYTQVPYGLVLAPWQMYGVGILVILLAIICLWQGIRETNENN